MSDVYKDANHKIQKTIQRPSHIEAQEERELKTDLPKEKKDNINLDHLFFS